jgi:F-type H+-transporting ATPase subunit b
MVVCLAPALAVAGEAAGEDPVNTTTGFVFRILNFLIVAYGVWYAFGKVLPKVFRARAEIIARAISEAAQAKQEAQRQLQDAEKKLDHLDLEVNVLRENAQRDAAAESERIRAAAREDAAKVERAAELEIAAAERAARMELKAHAAQLAVERAEAMLRGRMTPDAEAALFRAFVSDLGRSAN